MERKSLKEIYTSPWLNNFFYFFIFSFVLYSLLFAFCSLLSETSGFSLWTEEEEERWIVSKEKNMSRLSDCALSSCVCAWIRPSGLANYELTGASHPSQTTTTTSNDYTRRRQKKNLRGGEEASPFYSMENQISQLDFSWHSLDQIGNKRSRRKFSFCFLMNY